MPSSAISGEFFASRQVSPAFILIADPAQRRISSPSVTVRMPKPLISGRVSMPLIRSRSRLKLSSVRTRLMP